MKKFVFAVAALFALSVYAQEPDHAPVYRGQYYAFDVYPYGYQGYPGFPYYGAPFGSGGPAFAVTEQQTNQGYAKDVRSSRAPRKHAHAARSAR